MKRAVLALALLSSFAAFAQDPVPPPTIPPLKMTTVTTQADGSVISTTYEIGGSFAYQVFAGLLASSTTVDDRGITKRNFLAFTDKNGNVFTRGSAGEVYRNGVRLYSVSSTGAPQKMLAAKLVSAGNEVYALGMTNSTWYKWDGTATVNKWVALPVDFDTSILQ